MTTKIYAQSYAEAWKQYTGGYWAELIIPFETWTIRPDGGIAKLRPNKFNADHIRVLKRREDEKMLPRHVTRPTLNAIDNNQ